MNLTLKTFKSDDYGTFGQLFLEDEQLCYTVELPWKDNHHETSCIPAGIYECIPHSSDKFPNTWEITGVPDRSAILIHSANTIQDLRGCVGVGNRLGFVNDLPAVLNSKKTLDMLRSTLDDYFTLTIKR